MSRLSLKLTPRSALILFIAIALVALTQAVWWIVFMANLTNEKVELAQQLGADQAFIDRFHEQEISRQIMLGMEGVFFLVLILLGAWLIYRALVRNEELKFHQQNFLLAVTHELKTPISSIKIYLDSLDSPKIAPERKTEIMPRLRESTLQLERLVESVLQAARFDQAGYQLAVAPFSLSELFERKVAEFRRLPAKRPLSLEAESAPGIEVSGDQVALGRALESIVENGIKYNESETIRLKLVLAVERGRVVISVTDNGIGLEPGDRSRIFERFYRVGNELRRSRPGTGLGLYLTREIIRAHKGRIEAISDGPGRGSTFRIELPLERLT